MTRRGWVLFGALSVIWGIPYLLIKIAVADVDPLIVAFGRTLIAALLLLPIALYRRALDAGVPAVEVCCCSTRWSRSAARGCSSGMPRRG